MGLTENQRAERAIPGGERRRHRRARVAQPVRVRLSYLTEDDLDEVCCTLDASRQGLYFSTLCERYKRGTRLFITSPYSSDPGALNVDYLGQVVRVDPLPQGSWAVAVHLLTIIHVKRHETVLPQQFLGANRRPQR